MPQREQGQVDEYPLGRPKTMLRLPLDGRLRCGCIPVLGLTIAVLLAVMAVRLYVPGRARRTPVPPPTQAVRVPTSTPVPTPTASPLPATPTLVLPATPTQTPMPTSTPTSTPSPSLTPTPSPTSTPTSTAVVTEEGATVCSPDVVGAVSRAVETQAQYMLGTLSAEALSETWGGAAGDAQAQADQLIGYRDRRILSVDMVDVAWTLVGCEMEARGNWVRVTLEEQWTYVAELECASGTTLMASWVEAFPAEVYVLTRTEAGWRVDSWLSGPAEVTARWTCP